MVLCFADHLSWYGDARTTEVRDRRRQEEAALQGRRGRHLSPAGSPICLSVQFSALFVPALLYYSKVQTKGRRILINWWGPLDYFVWLCISCLKLVAQCALMELRREENDVLEMVLACVEGGASPILSVSVCPFGMILINWCLMGTLFYVTLCLKSEYLATVSTIKFGKVKQLIWSLNYGSKPNLVFHFPKGPISLWTLVRKFNLVLGVMWLPMGTPHEL